MVPVQVGKVSEMEWLSVVWQYRGRFIVLIDKAMRWYLKAHSSLFSNKRESNPKVSGIKS